MDAVHCRSFTRNNRSRQCGKGSLQELMSDLAPWMQTRATVSIGFAFIAGKLLSDLALYHLAGSVASASGTRDLRPFMSAPQDFIF